MEIKNDGRLKICWMRIVGYQQFQDVLLDFRHPETGEPLDKICLIGANGTGKTVVLEMLNTILSNEIQGPFIGMGSKSWVVCKCMFNGVKFHLSIHQQGKTKIVFHGNHLDEEWWRSEPLPSDILISDIGSHFPSLPKKWQLNKEDIELIKGLKGAKNENFMVITSPAESKINSGLELDDVPHTNLNDSIAYGKLFSPIQNVDAQEILQFWKLLIFQTYLRREAQNAFELKEENIRKRKIDLIEEFDQKYPQILKELAQIWNRILKKAGLEFDIENAIIPFSMDQNLYAYIINSATKEKIDYNRLSTGMRSYIFRIGHIFSLYFNRKLQNSFLLVDEPENGLFPDFLYDLVDVYRQVTTDKNGENNTQMFFATHEPIIAAQFEPYERIILEWNDDGTVRTRKGVAPIGDDPNDLLRKDFAVQSLMGEEGKMAWKRYAELQDAMEVETDKTKLEQISDEYMRLGREYNFPA